VLIAGLAYGALVQLIGDAQCEPFEGGSDYGKMRWSAWPLGPTCTFTADVHGFDAMRGPHAVMSAWLVVLAIGAVFCGVIWAVVVRSSRTTGVAP
jgi:hypothetical protein